MDRLKPTLRPWLELEPDYARGAFSIGTWLTSLCLSGSLAAFNATELGQRWLGAHVGATIACTVIQPLVWAVRNWVVGVERALRPSYWPVHLVSLTATSALTATYAATSAETASSAWLVLLGFGLLNATIIRPTLLMLPIFVVPAVLLRLAFVPGATPASFAVAVGAGVAGFIVYWRLACAVQAQRGLALGAHGGDPLVPGAERRTAELRVAMQLHDELSGALLATRRKLERAPDEEATRVAAREWLARLSATLDRGSRAAGPVAPQLERFAAWLGLDLELSIRGRPEGLRDTDRDDFMAIATELLANQAAHGGSEGRAATLSISVDSRAITLEGLQVPSATHKARGRGQRNIEQRIAARGGVFDPKNGLVRWKRFATAEEVLLGGAWQAAATAVIAACILVVLGTRASTLVAAGASVLYCSIFVGRFYLAAARARTEREQSWIARVDDASEEPLALAKEAFRQDGEVAALALDRGDLERARAAFERLAASLRDVLWALEWAGTPELLEGDLADVACTVGATPPPTITEEMAESARCRLALRRAIVERTAA